MKKRSINKKEKTKCINKPGCSCPGWIYSLGVIGSVIYYVSNANGFWMGVLGILKALIWPAILIFKLLSFIGA